MACVCVCVQEDKLRDLYAQHSSEKGYLAVIAEELMGGFSKGQIGSQLRKLGLRPDKGKKRKSQVTQLSMQAMLLCLAHWCCH